MENLTKINNPFIATKGDEYHCFGCSPDNKAGLLMEFYTDGSKVYAEWTPTKTFEGYHNVVHGGIQSTLMDEIASWTVYALLDTAGVTQKMTVDYHKSLFLSHGNVKVESEVKVNDGKTATMFVEVKNSKGEVCSSAEVVYFLFPSAVARRKFNYPGKEAFVKK